MKNPIRVPRLLLWFSLFAFVGPGFTDQARTPQVNTEARLIVDLIPNAIR
jgi:hypothetical protein